MKIEMTVEFDRVWIVSLQETRPTPARALSYHLRRKSGIQILDVKDNRLRIAFSENDLLESAVVEMIYSYLTKRYPETDLSTVISIKVNNQTQSIRTDDSDDDDAGSLGFEEALRDLMPEEAEEKPDPMEQISALVGGEEFKLLAEECVKVAPGLIKHNIIDTFIRRCYLFAINDGEGLTTYLELFAKLLTHLKLIEITPTRPIVEIAISGGDKATDSISSACNTIRRNGSGRILCIDISECMTKLHEPRFRVLLECINDSATKNIVVFRVPFVEKDVLNGIKKSISDILSVRAVSMVPFDTQELMLCATDALQSRGFTISEDAREILQARIVEEKSDGRFYGINTVNKVVREMIYMKQIHNALEGVDDSLIKKAEILELSASYDHEEKCGLDMLDDYIGMKKIKSRVEEIVFQIEMALKNPQLGNPCIHMRFVGNPGTGKTTVARVIGKILKERGILRKGSFFEHSGRDFCGRYVGETAPKTAAMCRDAYGSVLFIDEAYSLYRSGASSVDFGREAIDTLIAEMENHRSDLVVIMAGYTDEMATLMEANPGLESRMPYVIEFPSYDRSELTEIFMSMVSKSFQYSDELRPAVEAYFNNLPEEMLVAKSFSNARFVRNLFERTWGKAGIRAQLNHEPEIVVLPEDFKAASAEKEFNRLVTKKTRTLGFV